MKYEFRKYLLKKSNTWREIEVSWFFIILSITQQKPYFLVVTHLLWPFNLAYLTLQWLKFTIWVSSIFEQSPVDTRPTEHILDVHVTSSRHMNSCMYIWSSWYVQNHTRPTERILHVNVTSSTSYERPIHVKFGSWVLARKHFM